MKNNRSPIKMVMIFSLVVIALIVVLVAVNNNSATDTTEENTHEQQPSIEGQPTLGDSEAPVSVVEFGDFKCPACKAWGAELFPKLVNDYVDSGQVEFSFINVLFHGEESELGSLAAESVYKQNPDAYWDFHKALFEEQPSCANHDQLWITNEKVLEVASTIPGINVDELETDLENQAEIEEVNLDSELVTEFDVQRTPTIMVNNITIEDPFDYEAIKEAIESELEGNQ